MNKELKFICAQPDDTYYIWQVNLWLESLKNLGHIDKTIVLIFVPKDREYNTKWDKLIELYPETTFKIYKDEHKITELLGIYISIHRPYSLWRFWKENPEMENKAIFYCDSDVLFTKEFNIDKYIDDDVCYLSDTNGYINATYFDGKIRDVLPHKLEEYKKIDVLNSTLRLLGLTREIAVKNNMHSGGAQYLLKNISTEFWHKMINDTISIRVHLQEINKQYFANENKGFQSFCSDMWALLYGLWAINKECKVIKEMNFAWAPDPIEKLNTHTIFHNAGVIGEFMDGVNYFFKGKYHSGLNPLIDPHLDVVLNSESAKKKCTWYYANALDELKKKYKHIYE